MWTQKVDGMLLVTGGPFFFAGAMLALAVAPVSAVAGEWTARHRHAYTEVRDRTRALHDARNLSGLEQLGREIEQSWRESDLELYARSILALCGALAGTDRFGTTRNEGLARSFAVRALEKADETPLEVECRLLGFVRFDIDAEGNILKGENVAERRTESLRLWLHAWQRVEKSIDPNWDPQDTGVLNVIPPRGLRPGTPPSAVEDPELRAEYEAAIEAHRNKRQKSRQQHKALDLKRYWLPRAERHIIRVYMQTPERRAELQQLLLQYEVDPVTVQTILEAVEKRQMPEHLTRRITTQPSKPGS